jgi:hypothetical protein
VFCVRHEPARLGERTLRKISRPDGTVASTAPTARPGPGDNVQAIAHSTFRRLPGGAGSARYSSGSVPKRNG